VNDRPHARDEWRERLRAPAFQTAQRRGAGFWRWASRQRRRLEPLASRVFGPGLNDTASPATELEHFDRNNVWYEPSGWRDLRRALPQRSVQRSDVFVDLGCGKGRVVYAAARHYNFARVIGVEISPALADQARENIRLAGPRLLCPVDIVTSDVRDWTIPDDVTVAYYYYAFVGETFAAVIDALLSSLDRAPRRLLLVTRLAVPAYLEETGRFELVRRRRLLYQADRDVWLAIYVAGPASRG
jgi:SAM-dependent methyltransferase